MSLMGFRPSLASPKLESFLLLHSTFAPSTSVSVSFLHFSSTGPFCVRRGSVGLQAREEKPILAPGHRRHPLRVTRGLLLFFFTALRLSLSNQRPQVAIFVMRVTLLDLWGGG